MNNYIDTSLIVDKLFNFFSKIKKELNISLYNEGLSISKMKVLNLIKNNYTSATNIKNIMKFSSRTVVTVLDSLEKDELLNRKLNLQDRRIKYVIITDKGLKKLKLAENIQSNILNKTLSKLTKNEIEKFNDISNIIENIK